MKKALFIFLSVIAVIIIAAAVFHAPLAGLIIDIRWWDSIGLLTVPLTRAAVGALAFLAPAAAVFAVLVLYTRLVRGHKINIFTVVLYALGAAAAGLYSLSHFPFWLSNFGTFSFGQKDPFFRMDAFVYLVRLPLWRALFTVTGLTALTLFVLDFFLYKAPAASENRKGRIPLPWPRLLTGILALSSLGALFILGLMETVVSQPAPKTGISYVTLNGIILPSLVWLLFCVISAAVWVVISAVRGLKLITVAVNSAVLGLLYLLMVLVYPALLGTWYVKPNELALQKPFMEYRRDFTRAGFGIRSGPVDPIPLPESGGIGSLLSRVRLWDNDPFMKASRQLQEFRSYFELLDADIDIYPDQEGHPALVTLAARELNPDRLPPEARSWDNLALRYTHGNGLVVSPAHLAGPDGGPVYWLSGLSNTEAVPSLKIQRPQIYFGERTTNAVIVRTKAEEFDYTGPEGRVTTVYSEDRGIPVYGFFSRLLFSIVLRDRNIFMTSYFTPQSRVLMHREILPRVKKIFPYLAYDSDPYPAVIDGKIIWIIEAYTVSARFPLSERMPTAFGNLNYIRSSVRVTVDAYTGDTAFYLLDSTDPIANSYASLFPGLFRRGIPDNMAAHVRYPYNMVAAQSAALSLYHSENPESLYNGDDRWQLPRHRMQEQLTNFDPYYLLYPESNRSLVSVVQPFNPAGRENLAGFLLASLETSPHVRLFRSPGGLDVPGPLQVEARLNQNDTLSQLLTLWGLKGSRIYRGNIKYLPLSGGMLIIAPIFLESATMAIPSLVRIAAVYNSQVVLAQTTEELITKLSILAKDSGGGGPVEP